MNYADAKPGGVLAMDLSSICGVAYGHLTDRLPTFFCCWVLPKIGGEGARYAAFENELIAAVASLAPSRIVLEAPLSFQALLGVSTMKVMAQQYTLRGIAYAEAWRASAAIQEVSSDIVRLAILGQSRFKKDTVKVEVVKHCRSIGLAVPDHNSGDACLVWLWFVGQLTGRPTAAAGPLFRETNQ